MNVVLEIVKWVVFDMLIKVDGKWLWDSLMEVVKIGVMLKGGVCCFVLIDFDKVGCDLIVGWVKVVGCMVMVDMMGNVFMCCVGCVVDVVLVVMGLYVDL